MRENIIAIVAAIVLVGGIIAAAAASNTHLSKRCADWGNPQSIACKPHNPQHPA